MSKDKLLTVDDFYVTKSTAGSLKDLVNSYKEYKNELKNVPRANRPTSDTAKLKFFKEVHNNRKGGTLFRKNDRASAALTLVWLSKVKELASFYASINNIKKFEGITKAELSEIARLSSDVDNLIHLEEFFSKRGIIFITEKSLSGAKLDGSVFILGSGQAVVALSLRYKRLDYFWFTLMHELAHLCLHHEQLHSPIIEDLDSEAESLIELEADKLALNSFIPRNIWRNCPPKYSFSKEVVLQFAQEQGIHPAIVAGRLRKELNRYDCLSEMVNSVDVRELL